jgi:hypothetical protein
VHVKQQRYLQHACRLRSRETRGVVIDIADNSTNIGTNTTGSIGHADRDSGHGHAR